MQLFGALHLSLLLATAVVLAVLSVLCRRGWLAARAVRLTIGWALLINEIIWWAFRYSHEGLHANNLPLQLCDLTVWLSVAACLSAAPLVTEFAYFAGIAGAGMALLTPDLWSPWPSYPAVYFFIAHGGIVIAVGVLAFGRIVAFRAGAVWRAFGMLLGYAAMVGGVNALCGSNYMYLCRKPGNQSLLDRMGAWPWYLVGGAALALAIFWLLWLPVRPRDSHPIGH